MSKNPANAPLLDEAHAAFIQRRVAINVGGRDADNVPALVRALGCRVSPDRRRVTVFLSVPRSRTLLDDIRDNGRIAVVMSRPSTHQTIQLKGTDAATAPLEDGDRALMAAYQDSFVQELIELGYLETFARAVVSGQSDEIVAVTFTPVEAFVQTPGPGAGQRLGGSA
jgi:hypothetical protein